MSQLLSEVWIAEVGCYSDRYVAGVYSSREIAKAHFPHVATWEESENNSDAATNRAGIRCDWDEAVMIAREKVIATMPEPKPEKVLP